MLTIKGLLPAIRPMDDVNYQEWQLQFKIRVKGLLNLLSNEEKNCCTKWKKLSQGLNSSLLVTVVWKREVTLPMRTVSHSWPLSSYVTKVRRESVRALLYERDGDDDIVKPDIPP